MIIRSLDLSGFGSTVNSCHYDFDTGVTYITGCNGAGKTTILDGIRWALFGTSRSVRITQGDKTSVINDSAQQARVTVIVSNSSGSVLSVVRSLSRAAHNSHTLSVSIDGKAVAGGIKKKQQAIHRHIGNIHEDVFASASMLSSAPSSPVNVFVSATQKERREILSHIIDPYDEYAEKFKQASKKLRQVRSDMRAAEGRLEGLRQAEPRRIDAPQGDIDSIRADVSRAEMELAHIRADSDDISREDTVRRYESERNDIARRIKHLNQDIKDDEDSKRSLLQRLQATHGEYDTQCETKGKLDARLRAIELEITVSSGIMSEEQRLATVEEGELADKKRINLLSQLYPPVGEECPVCCRVVDVENPHVETGDITSRHRNLLLAMTERASDIKAMRRDVLREMRAVSRDIDNHRQTIQSIREAVCDIDDRLKRNRCVIDNGLLPQLQRIDEDIEQARQYDDGDKQRIYDEVQARYQEATGRLHDYIQELSVYERSCAERERYDGMLHQAREHLERCRADVEKYTAERDYFSPQGHMSSRIQSVMDELSSLSTQYMRRIFMWEQSPIVIGSSDAAEEQGCDITVRGRSISTFSYGEQMRIIISISLAFRELLSGDTDETLPLMWDEVAVTIDGGWTRWDEGIVSHIDDGEQAFIVTREDVRDMCIGDEARHIKEVSR